MKFEVNVYKITLVLQVKNDQFSKVVVCIYLVSSGPEVQETSLF